MELIVTQPRVPRGHQSELDPPRNNSGSAPAPRLECARSEDQTSHLAMRYCVLAQYVWIVQLMVAPYDRDHAKQRDANHRTAASHQMKDSTPCDVGYRNFGAGVESEFVSAICLGNQEDTRLGFEHG